MAPHRNDKEVSNLGTSSFVHPSGFFGGLDLTLFGNIPPFFLSLFPPSSAPAAAAAPLPAGGEERLPEGGAELGAVEQVEQEVGGGVDAHQEVRDLDKENKLYIYLGLVY